MLTVTWTSWEFNFRRCTYSKYSSCCLITVKQQRPPLLSLSEFSVNTLMRNWHFLGWRCSKSNNMTKSSGDVIYNMVTIVNNAVFAKRISLKTSPYNTSLVVQSVRLSTPDAEGLGSIPGQETRSHMPQLKISCAATKTWRFFVFVCSVMTDSFVTTWTVAHQALLFMGFMPNKLINSNKKFLPHAHTHT